MRSLFTVLLLLIATTSFASVYDFKDNSNASTTLSGTSYSMRVAGSSYSGTPYAIQVYSGSSPVGTIQGILAKSDEIADQLTQWQDLTDGTISADGFFHVFGPVTHIRIVMTSGTCKARLYQNVGK